MDEIELKSETIEELKKLAETLDKKINQDISLQYEELDYLVNNHKMSSSPHEIVFEIIATVLEENNKGEVLKTKEIMTKKFHIPVPINKDYNEFMGTFFNYIQTNLLEASNKAYEVADKDNTNG